MTTIAKMRRLCNDTLCRNCKFHVRVTGLQNCTANTLVRYFTNQIIGEYKLRYENVSCETAEEIRNA